MPKYTLDELDGSLTGSLTMGAARVAPAVVPVPVPHVLYESRRAFYWSTALVTLGYQGTSRMFNSRKGDLFYAYDTMWRAPMIQESAHTNMYSPWVLPHAATIRYLRFAIPEVVSGDLMANGVSRVVDRETVSLFLQTTRLSFLVGARRIVDTVLAEGLVETKKLSEVLDANNEPTSPTLRTGYTDAVGTYHLRIPIPGNAVVRQQEHVRVELETACDVRPLRPLVVIGMLEGVEQARID